MPPIGFAGIWRGRMHYAWIVLTVMFSATLAGVGVRAAPGVMIVPLQRERYSAGTPDADRFQHRLHPPLRPRLMFSFSAVRVAL